MATRAPERSRSVLPQYIALAVTWGASFLFIKIGLEGLSPAQVVLGRLLTGALALAVISIARRQSLPRDPSVWVHLLVVAILLCVAPFLLFAWAEKDISSGLASIYNATTPLMTMLVSLAALPAERPTRSRLVGLAVGVDPRIGGALAQLVAYPAGEIRRKWPATPAAPAQCGEDGARNRSAAQGVAVGRAGVSHCGLG